MFYFAIGTFDPAHLNDAVLLLADGVTNLYQRLGLGAFGFNWHLSTTKVVFRDAEGSLYRATVADALAGTSESACEGAQVSYLIDWVSNDDRRGGKPRQYIAGVAEAVCTDSVHVNAPTLASMNAGLSDWLAANASRAHGTANGLQLLEMSFRNGKTWRDAAHTWPIRGGSISPEIATQRRRVDRLRL